MRISRRVLLAVLSLAFLYLAISVRRLDAPGALFVVEPLGPLSGPRVARGGWRIVPRLLGRVAAYPGGSARTRVEMRGARSVLTREGASIELRIHLVYSIDPERLIDLHRRHGPRFETGWLADRVRSAVAEQVAGRDAAGRDGPIGEAAPIRGAIDDAVRPDGIRVESVRVVAFGGPGSGVEGIVPAGVEPIDRTVVLIGVDAFDWRVIDPLVQAGRMPNLEALVARGARAHLRTLRPILSPVVWTSIATGAGPARHGIVDFVVTARDTGAPIPVTSSMRRVPALWEILGAQGIEGDVVAWWATWPATPFPGRMVTDRVAYQLFRETAGGDWRRADPEADRAKTWPPSLLEEIRPLIRLPAEIRDDELEPLLGGRLPPQPTEGQRERLDGLRTIVAAAATYHAIALRLFRYGGPGFRTVYYEGPDTASHLFMGFRPPALEGFDPTDAAIFGEVVDRFYELQDRYIGEIVAAAGEDAVIVLVSDHGFKSGSDRPPRSDPRIGGPAAADWHTPVGVLVLAGPGIRAGFDLGAASVLDVAPTLIALYGLPVPRDMDGQPLVAAFEEKLLERRPLAWIDSYGGREGSMEPAAGTGGPQQAELLEKLRNLGYIGEERLTAHNNRGLLALEEGDLDAAIDHFERALDSGESSPSLALNNLAEAWRRRGDPERARTHARRALAADPRNKHAEVILARVAEAAGDPGAAEAHLRRALDIDPAFAQAHALLGALREARGDDAGALAAYRRAVEIAPLGADEHARIGEIHRRRGELEEAARSFEEALRCDRRHLAAMNNFGLTLQEMGRLDAARELYERGLTMRPGHAVLLNSLGTLLALQGKTDEAIARIEEAVRSDPGWPVAQGNLALLLDGSPRAAEAGAAFERWIALEPESGGARIGLAEWHLRRGEVAAARALLEEAARLAPRDARAQTLLGEVYLRLGRTEEAIRALRRSLAIDPGQDGVRRRLAEIGG